MPSPDHNQLFGSWRGRMTTRQEEYYKLGEQHMQHDLTPEDRAKLERAAGKLTTHITVGSFIGLGLGVLLSLRLRSRALTIVNAARRMDKPVAVQYSDGHTEQIPDLSQFLRSPSPVATGITAFLFGTAGVFLGGEVGFLTGTASAKSEINSDPESRKRIDTGFRKFKADVLRKEAEEIERGEGELGF